jgi:TPR repeat protein
MAALAGCAGPSDYAGIRLAAGAAEPGLQALARRARAGDRSAQIELGSRFEEGRGVPLDRARACAIYLHQRAADSGDMWIYSPATKAMEHHRQPAPGRADRDLLAFKAYECRVARLGRAG